MKFFTYSLTLLLLPIQLVCAQSNDKTPSTGNVSGVILDEKHQPLSFANVLIITKKDSALIKGMAADENGRFTFDRLPAGNYRMIVSMAGFETSRQELLVENNSSIQIPEMIMKVESKSLSEVTVSAKKPFIEQQIDRTIVHVENSIISAGGTALEVLERAPGITVDQQNEQISLKGKQGVIVQIDGKQAFLSQQEVVNLLRNTPSANIEKIELIANPSAKYDAAGNSGIINIKMKRNQNYGTSGNVNLGVGHARYGRGNVAFALNHNDGKFSTFMSGTGTIVKNFRNNIITRKIPFNNQMTISDQKTERITNNNNYNIRGGLDYAISKKTTAGILFSGFRNHLTNPYGQTNAHITKEDQGLQSSFRTDVNNGSSMLNTSYNLNFKHRFNDVGTELTFDADHVFYTGSKSSKLETLFYAANGQPNGDSEAVRNKMPSDITVKVAKLDYAQPLWKSKLETGIKFTYANSENDMAFEVKQDDWIVDTTRSNKFNYVERISAAYLNFGGNFTPRLKYQFGIRGEQTQSMGNSVTLHKKQNRNYLNLFPSLFITMQIDTNNVINLSYSRRIDRPNYQSLNPFEFYLDPFNYIKGNPNLRPQYTDSFQMTHVFGGYVNTSLSYSRIKDLIADELPQQIAAENKTFLTSGNLDKQDNFNFTVAFPVHATKWWTAQVNFISVYNFYESYYLGEKLKMTQLSWNLNVSNQFTLTRGWSAELTGWYNSKGVYALYRTDPMGLVNAGIQKTVFNKKGIIRINVNDIFWTNRFHGHAVYEDIDYDVRSIWPSRQVRLALTYNFGNQNVKGAKVRKTGSEDLQNRVNNGN